MIGDNIGTLTSLASGYTLDIRPDTNRHWIIHNLYYDGTVDIEMVSGNNSLLIEDGVVGPEALCTYHFHLTNTFYMRIVNKDGDSKVVGYDGIISK